ncbi:MAG: hypothetical protein ACP5QS_07585, partial [bacterium]
LSFLRLASAEGILPFPLQKIDILLFLIRPTVLQFLQGEKLKLEERDRRRAVLLRETLGL